MEVTTLGSVIESWFDKKRDWTPAPLEAQKTWIAPGRDDDVENHEFTYTASSKDLFTVCNDRSRVVCWMYDKEKQLYSVKRFNGKLEYFKRPQDFFLLPNIDPRSINNVVFKNPSEDSQADLFAKFLKDQCDKDFPTMKSAKGRRFTSTCILDPVKKQPSSISIIVRDLDDYFILDPMDLLKFGKDDMMVLHKNPIRTYGGYQQEAKPFTKVIVLAIAHKLYAGAGPHLATLSID
ncbi:hypothetical protein R6Q59_023921 [Mikania micrantha]